MIALYAFCWPSPSPSHTRVKVSDSGYVGYYLGACVITYLDPLGSCPAGACSWSSSRKGSLHAATLGFSHDVDLFSC